MPVPAASISPSVLKKLDGDMSVKFLVSNKSSHEVNVIPDKVVPKIIYIINFFIIYVIYRLMIRNLN